MKELLRKFLYKRGYAIARLDPFEPGSPYRGVGNMKWLLEDMKARGFKCDAILDVGAHRAHWSMMAKEVFPDAHYYLIEPQTEMEADISEFCRQTKNAVYVIAGAGATNDVKLLTIEGDLAGATFLPREDEALKSEGKQNMVKIITIDDFIAQNNLKIPELAKLDIQGYELEALKGANSLFGKTEAFILEVSLFPFGNDIGMPVISDVIDFMNQRNYVVYDFPGFSRRAYDGALGQCDICFVKQDSFLRASNRWE